MKYKPQTKDELIDLIEKKTKFNKIDTSLITDMSGLFKDSMLRNFSGIETWDTSNVKDMSFMFFSAESFNQSIENWTINKSCYIKDIFSSSYNDIKSILKIYFIAKGNYKKQLISMLENCDIKEVYKEVLKYNKLKDFIKKLENIYYEELKELIENKENILKEYKKGLNNEKI